MSSRKKLQITVIGTGPLPPIDPQHCDDTSTVDGVRSYCRIDEVDIQIDLHAAIDSEDIGGIATQLVGCGQSVLVQRLNVDRLESDLLLTSALLDLDRPMIYWLENVDSAEKQGRHLDQTTLSALLQAPVITEERGWMEVLNAALACDPTQPGLLHAGYDDHLETVIMQTRRHLLELHPDTVQPQDARWLVIRLLQQDPAVERQEAAHHHLLAEIEQQRQELLHQHQETVDSLLLQGRHGLVNGVMEEACRWEMPKSEARIEWTRLMDRLLLHPILGLPIFLLLLWVMFETTFTLGGYPMEWIDNGVILLSEQLQQLLPESLFKELLINGILAGVGGTIIFLPNIVILFFYIALFSESGYMARGAILVDRLMHRFGLHGKAFIPMVTGFGCNVPAILATRTIDNPRDRLVAILVNPFISCSARLPVFVLFAGAFFPDNPGSILFAIYMISVGVALTTALVLSKTVVRGANTTPMLMDLPPYRLPSLTSLYHHMGASGVEFLKKVTGIILVGSTVIWLLQTFPQDIPTSIDYQQEINQLKNQPESLEQQQQIEKLRRSEAMEIQHGRYLGQLGGAIQPLFEPLEFDINASIALLTGVVAKEVVVATFGVLLAQGEETNEESEGLRRSLAASMSPVTAVTFMVFTLFYFPCLATLAVIYKETRSLQWTAFSVALSLSLAYTLALLTHLLGTGLT